MLIDALLRISAAALATLHVRVVEQYSVLYGDLVIRVGPEDNGDVLRVVWTKNGRKSAVQVGEVSNTEQRLLNVPR